MVLTQKSGLLWERRDIKWGTWSISTLCLHFHMELAHERIMVSEWCVRQLVSIWHFKWHDDLKWSFQILCHNTRGFTEFLQGKFKTIKYAKYPLKSWLFIIIQPRLQPPMYSHTRQPSTCFYSSACTLTVHLFTLQLCGSFFLWFNSMWFMVIILCQLCLHDVFYNQVSLLLIPDTFFALHCSVSRFPPSSCFTLHSHFLSLWAGAEPSTFSSSSFRPSIKSWIYYVKQNRAMTLCPRPSVSLVQNE